MTRPSKLWRTLGATQSLFQVVSLAHGSVFFYDYDLTEVSLTRGTTLAGLSTSGGHVGLTGKAPTLSGANTQSLRVELTPHGIARLNALGVATDATTFRRFHGRVTGQTITDLGGDRYTSTVNVQDWAALISQLDKGAAVQNGNNGIDELVDSLFYRAGTPAGPLTKWGSSWHLVRFVEGDPEWIDLSTSDALSLIADAGVFVRTLRDGRVVVWAHDHIVDVAANWADYWPDTLLRAQVLSPAEWVQPPSITTQMSYTKVNSVGVEVSGTVTIGSPGYIARAQHLDLTKLQEQGAGLTDRIVAVASQAGPGRPRVEQVSIDVLGLLRRGNDTDLDTLSQLLSTDHGEIVVFAHDWPAEVLGVAFIESMTETITPDAWRIELALVPANHVTGRPVPPVRGRTWDSAYPAVTTWDGVPNDPAWDEH